MAKVFDFEYYRMKKLVEKRFRSRGLVFEVYMSTVEFVHYYIEPSYDNPVEHLTTDVSLKHLYDGNRDRFIATFSALVKYWEIEPMPHKELPIDREFEMFPTLGDLCKYIEKRVKYL
ncbi:hypothetical protein [Halobacillus sp. BBL2006]|uniref:hypothetical protein n=1 Tax=Halobacillus sp. BBL2006 TaxID=1543706 RepID=UPI0005425CF4|nr:hypothetical protein [Halobacillus sp. BBL2006]KHE67555.1 hypothetical protein LD39_16935 [Halobacillus sp. BBL2006]